MTVRNGHGDIKRLPYKVTASFPAKGHGYTTARVHTGVWGHTIVLDYFRN